MKFFTGKFPILAAAHFLAMTTVLVSLGSAEAMAIRPWLLCPWNWILDPIVDFLHTKVFFVYGRGLDSAIRWNSFWGVVDTLYVIIGCAWWYALAAVAQRMVLRLRGLLGIAPCDLVEAPAAPPRTRGPWVMIMAMALVVLSADAVLLVLRQRADYVKFTSYIDQIYAWNSGVVNSRKYTYLMEGGIPTEAYDAVVASLPFSEIVMERSPCYGSCPAYRVSLAKNGVANYRGDGAVPRMGTHTGTVLFTSFAHLCNAMQNLGFQRLDEKYQANWTDDSSTTLTLYGETSNVVKRVYEYGGVGPIELWTLQEAVDAVAEKIVWRKTGN